MLLFPVTVVIGLAIGAAFGGRLRHLAAVRWRALPLVAAAVGVQVVLSVGAVRTALGGRNWDAIVVSYALLGAWLCVNVWRRHGPVRTGVLLATIGWLLNVVVMIPNGGMPVSVAALEAAGAPAQFRATSGHLYKHVEATSASELRPLGDVIPVRALKTVISLGDIVMLAGIATIVAAGMQEGTESEGGEDSEADGDVEDPLSASGGPARPPLDLRDPIALEPIATLCSPPSTSPPRS